MPDEEFLIPIDRAITDFRMITDAYSIRVVKLNSYHDLNKYKSWITDGEPCLFDISLPEVGYITSKMNWETGKIYPSIPLGLENSIVEILRKS